MQRDIKCSQCGSLFGKELDDPAGGSPLLTIKNRDLYRTYRGGVVWGPCRGCGAAVSWPRRSDDSTGTR